MKPTAKNVLEGGHAVSPNFFRWCDKRKIKPTKRQARKYLAWVNGHNMKWS